MFRSDGLGEKNSLIVWFCCLDLGSGQHMKNAAMLGGSKKGSGKYSFAACVVELPFTFPTTINSHSIWQALPTDAQRSLVED